MIVVTGGAGFIGSCLVARLNELGKKDLLIVDHMEQGSPKKRNLENKHYVDYLDKSEFLEQIFSNRVSSLVKSVIHMGACSSTTCTDADYFKKNNFEYSQHLAKWAIEQDVRFIYASSAATYGDGRLGYKDDDETTRSLKPLNLYGDSKQKFDLWLLNKNLIDKVVGLKFFNVYGPNEYHKGEMRSVIAKAYDRVLKEGKMELFKSYKAKYADGEQKRDFIYVKDAVEIILFFLEHPEVNGIFNVGTGKARTWKHLAKALFSSAQKKYNVEYIEMPEHLRSRYQYFTQAEVSKLKQAGYKRPFFTLEEGVADYCQYLKDKTFW